MTPLCEGSPNRRISLKEVCRNPRTDESVRFFKRDAEIRGPLNQFGFLKRDAGIHEPLYRSEFLKGDAGFHGPLNRSEF